MRPSQLASLNTIRWQRPPWCQPLSHLKRCDWVKNKTLVRKSSQLLLIHVDSTFVDSFPHMCLPTSFFWHLLCWLKCKHSFWEAPSPQPMLWHRWNGAQELENWEDTSRGHFYLFHDMMPKKKQTTLHRSVYQHVHGKHSQCWWTPRPLDTPFIDGLDMLARVEALEVREERLQSGNQDEWLDLTDGKGSSEWRKTS